MITLTKEWLLKTIAGLEEERDAVPGVVNEDAAMALRAMKLALASLEAEPAIHRWRRVTVEPYGPYPWHYGNFIGFSKPVEGIEDEYFYSAPPAPVSVHDYPDVLPCQVMLEPGLRFGKGVQTKTMLGALQRRVEYYAELEAMTPEQRAEHEAGMKEFAAMLQGGNGVTNGKPLTITLPDISSKAFWSGIGKNETFHPETYRRWVKEAIERSCTIARVDVEVK